MRRSPHAVGMSGTVATAVATPADRSSSPIAACITGQFRTLDRSCVGARLTARVLQPLHAHTFAFVKVPSTEAAQLEQYDRRVRAALHGANLAHLNVSVQSDPTQPCPHKRRAGSTYAMLIGLWNCYSAMQAFAAPQSVAHRFSWVFRFRTDSLVHFRVERLPDEGVPRHVIYSAAASQCGCGRVFRMGPCDSTVENIACRQVDDTFALLRGRAIKAYLHDPYAEFCEMSSGNEILGDLLVRAHALERDVRFISSLLPPVLFRQHFDCNASSSSPASSPILLKASSLRAIPPGPWDERRNGICAAARLHLEHELCIREDGHLMLPGYPTAPRRPRWLAHASLPHHHRHNGSSPSAGRRFATSSARVSIAAGGAHASQAGGGAGSSLAGGAHASLAGSSLAEQLDEARRSIEELAVLNAAREAEVRALHEQLAALITSQAGVRVPPPSSDTREASRGVAVRGRGTGGRGTGGRGMHHAGRTVGGAGGSTFSSGQPRRPQQYRRAPELPLPQLPLVPPPPPPPPLSGEARVARDAVTLATDKALFNQQWECLRDTTAKPPFQLTHGQEAVTCIDHLANLAAAHNTIPSSARAPRRVADLPVGGVILVHYSRNPCRLKSVLAMFRRLGLPWRVGAQLQIAQNLDREDVDIGLMRRCVSCKILMPYGRLESAANTFDLLSQVSCTVNHMYAYHLAQRMGWGSTLILEDDARLPDEFVSQLRKRLSMLPAPRPPQQWTIYNFACSPPNLPIANPFKPGSQPCSRGYVLSRAGVAHFARTASVVRTPADWTVWGVSARSESTNYSATWQGGIKVYEGSLVRKAGKALGPKMTRGTDLCEATNATTTRGHRPRNATARGHHGRLEASASTIALGAEG